MTVDRVSHDLEAHYVMRQCCRDSCQKWSYILLFSFEKWTDISYILFSLQALVRFQHLHFSGSKYKGLRREVNVGCPLLKRNFLLILLVLFYAKFVLCQDAFSWYTFTQPQHPTCIISLTYRLCLFPIV